MEVPVERVREIKKIAQEPVSLETPIDTTQTDAAVNRLFWVTERLREKYDCEPTNEELAYSLNWSVDYVREMRIAAQEIFVHDDTEDDFHLADTVVDEDAQDPFDATSFMLLKEQLKDVLDTLTAREKEVLRLRFGLKDGQPRFLEEVGKMLNRSRERIRQIEAKALRKLRHPARSKKLKDFLD